ncbi:MAG: GTPase HflX [Planctomycetes bacterium]|nr:GTPase HflX [Planctomycetota bacterium]
MVDLTRTELSVRTERAVLLGVILPDNQDTEMEELHSLARTAGAKVLGSVTQRRSAFDPACYVGRGKADDVAALCADLKADVVLCDSDLLPAQVRNLEKRLDTKVIDRTELILDIFASRAQTRQARCQVELAQLEYSLPRLKRMWTHLSRMEGGIGMRGPGEQQLEEDRRMVGRRIASLKQELRRIERRKESEVRSRSNQVTISLVGYTNAGKSTLMNTLTGAGVFVEDKLFATLETKTRSCDLGGGREILLSDTVGFIRRLPHHLVASFHATLEEARQADLLVHVCDVSAPDLWDQIAAVLGALSELACDKKPMITVLNKTDRLDGELDLPLIREKLENFVPISAINGSGVAELKRMLRDFVESREVEAIVRSDAGDGRLLAFLSRNGRVLGTEYSDGKANVRVRLKPKFIAQLRKSGCEVHTGGMAS